MVKSIILSFFFLIFLSKNIYSQEKIVFIDLNFIFNNSNAGKHLNSQIEKQSKELKIQINESKNDIENKKNKLLNQKNVLSAEEYAKKLSILENDIKKINSFILKKDKDLTLFKKTAEKEFFDKLNLIIEKYSLSNSISIILKKDDLLMAKKDLDITKDIFNIFNEKIKKLTIN
jgi:Skp family chaperone for outer membrane proteins